MGKLEDLTGKQFGNWLVIEGKRSTVLCECQCEKKTQRSIIRQKLLTGHSTSCSCLASNKRKQTTIERFGVDNASKNDIIKEKRKQTMIERLGVDNASKSPEIKEKKKQTNLKNRGVDHNMKDPLVREKAEQTNLKNLGVRNPFESEIVKEKIKKTNLKKYGDTYALRNPEIQEKSWQTRLSNPNHGFSSEAERELFEWIQQYYPNAHPSHTGDYQIDIWIEELKLAIEYNGLYWHSEAANRGKDYHLSKQKRIKEHKQGRTIFIWESEWNTRKDQIKNYLLSVLKAHNTKVGARKCIFKETPKSLASDFLDKTHIQGCSKKTIYALGCYYNDELISVATFGKHHRNGTQVVLNRFSCLSGFTVHGGLSKFSKLASEYFQSDIISWADLCKSEGNGYIESGWMIEEILPPDYFYISGHKSSVPISKQSRQKKLINTPEGMTEFEHAKLDGLLRVWDCGKIRLIYKYLP